MIKLKIGEKIKAKRKEHNLTQDTLANKLGVTKAAVSKWENAESYPDITMLPFIAKVFHITMDELFDYTLEDSLPNIVNEYHFGLSLDSVDKSILNHGTVSECEIHKKSEALSTEEGTWEVRFHFVSTEEDFPYILQKYLKRGVLVDGYSIRLADGKAIDDSKPNKHYVCNEKVWEYNIKDRNYLWRMLNEQIAMGLIDEEDTW